MIKKRIKNKFVKKTLRLLKYLYFCCVELLGSAVFFLARSLKLMNLPDSCNCIEPKRILLIRTDRIGDIVCSLPAIKAVREKIPDAFIAFLTTPYTKELVANQPGLDELITYDRKWSIIEKIRFIKKLKKYRFDVALVLCPYFIPALLAFLSAACCRVGYPLNGAGFLYTIRVDPKQRFRHEVEASLAVLEALGINAQCKLPKLYLSRQAQEFANSFFELNGVSSSETIVCIHPGGYEKHTQWHWQRYAELAEQIQSEFAAKIVLMGGVSEEKKITAIVAAMRHKPLIPDVANSLQRMAAIIRRCSVFVGNNSGPMHVAAAVGTPVVAIFGPIHPLEHENKWRPLSVEHRIVRVGMDCLDCHPGHCSDMVCMRKVTVEQVLEAVREIIAKI